MKVEYINPFIASSYMVIEATLGVKPEKGKLAVRQDGTTGQQCTIVTGVTGNLTGIVMYGMSLVTADKIASIMIGQPVRTFDQLAASAVAELGNMISGNAMSNLADAGYVCDISPPSIVRGVNVKITPVADATIVIPVLFEGGEIEISVSLKERNR